MKIRFDLRLLLLIQLIGEALALGVILLLFQLDGTISVSLYNHGLEFDYEWATPYWTYLRSALGLLGAIVGLHLLSSVYIIISDRNSRVKSEQL